MTRAGPLAELVKDVVLAGNLFQTLDRIDHIAGDFRWNQMGGGCGKGGQAPLPVTEGAPHVRIEEALVGGDVPAGSASSNGCWSGRAAGPTVERTRCGGRWSGRRWRSNGVA